MKDHSGGNTRCIQATGRMSPMCLPDLVPPRTNGNVVCFITMRAQFVLENILVKKEAFVWEEGVIVRSSTQETGCGSLICDICCFPSFRCI